MILMDDKKEVKFQLDSGATANLVRDSSAVWRLLWICCSRWTLGRVCIKLSDMIRASTFTFVFVLSTLCCKMIQFSTPVAWFAICRTFSFGALLSTVYTVSYLL
jgi:hypothetical protein